MSRFENRGRRLPPPLLGQPHRAPWEMYPPEQRPDRPMSRPHDPKSIHHQKRLDRLEQMLEHFIEKTAPSAAPVPPTDRDRVPEFVPGNPNMSMGRWLSKIDQMGEMHRWNDVEKIYHMQSGLRGLAKSWYDSRSSMNYSWSVWKTLLQEAFPENTDYAASLHKMLQRTKKPTETMASYFYNKIELLQMCKIGGRDAVSCVIDGLGNAALKNSARAGRYETPESLYDEYLCSVTEEPAVALPERPTKGPQTFSDQKKKLKCFKCGKTGHHSSKCLQHVQSRGPVAQVQSSGGYFAKVTQRKPEQEPSKARKCYTCGQSDHVRPMCPQRHSQNSKPPGRVNAGHLPRVAQKQAVGKPGQAVGKPGQAVGKPGQAVGKPGQPTNKRKASAQLGEGPSAVGQQVTYKTRCRYCRQRGHNRVQCPRLLGKTSNSQGQATAVTQEQVVGESEQPAKKRKICPEPQEGTAAVDKSKWVPPKCRKCHQLGHLKAVCPQLHGQKSNPLGQANAQNLSTEGQVVSKLGQPTNVLNQDGHKRKCYNCLQVGHVAADCSQPIKMCQNCKHLGHTSEECTRNDRQLVPAKPAADSQPKQIYFVGCNINGQPPSPFGFMNSGRTATILENIVLGYMNSGGPASTMTPNIAPGNMNSGSGALAITANDSSEFVDSESAALTMTGNMNSGSDASAITENVAPEDKNSENAELTITENVAPEFMNSESLELTNTENIAPEFMNSESSELPIPENIAGDCGQTVAPETDVDSAQKDDDSSQVDKTEVE